MKNNRYKQESYMVDAVYNITFWTVGIVIVLVLLIALFGGKEEKAFDAYLTDNKCSLSRVEETGNRVYCGKACTRAELKKTYTCEIGQNLIRIE